MLKWQANFLSGRFLSPDLNPYNGFIYWLNVGDSSGKAFTTWAEVEAATKAGDYYATGPFPGPYAALAAMSNANIITVFAGGEDPTDHRVAADAMRAYGWILGAGMPDLRTDAKYQVVPRMPDGTQIGVTEMRVVAPTALNTSFTFTGDNVFAYDKGIGRTTLNGTAGSDVMIDNSTNGGDRLAGQGGDDYLIGGTGTNVFAPGDGQDYALIRGGAARFEVSATSPGRLEIEGFRPGTDIITLTGTVSLASILASARSDGFGGTLVTISPGRSIRLNGLAPSRITGTMFDISDVLPPDIIFGTPGSDTLVGTAGADTMEGGAGNDIYYVDNAGDQVIEAAGGGTDNVYASVNYTLAAGQEVEILRVYGSAGLTLTGNELANTLIGGVGQRHAQWRWRQRHALWRSRRRHDDRRQRQRHLLRRQCRRPGDRGGRRRHRQRLCQRQLHAGGGPGGRDPAGLRLGRPDPHRQRAGQHPDRRRRATTRSTAVAATTRSMAVSAPT